MYRFGKSERLYFKKRKLLEIFKIFIESKQLTKYIQINKTSKLAWLSNRKTKIYKILQKVLQKGFYYEILLTKIKCGIGKFPYGGKIFVTLLIVFSCMSRGIMNGNFLIISDKLLVLSF